MAKRKKQTPAVPTAESIDEHPAEHYAAEDWRGHAHYACKYCPYDVLDNEQAMIEHVAAKHKDQIKE